MRQARRLKAASGIENVLKHVRYDHRNPFFGLVILLIHKNTFGMITATCFNRFSVPDAAFNRRAYGLLLAARGRGTQPAYGEDRV